MSRIYEISDGAGEILRYVRANSLNGAIRAYSHEMFNAKVATAEDIFQASKRGEFDVLDALASDDEADPGPVPLRAVT